MLPEERLESIVRIVNEKKSVSNQEDVYKRQRIDLRYTPELIFELDHSIEHGAHIEELLKKYNK